MNAKQIISIHNSRVSKRLSMNAILTESARYCMPQAEDILASTNGIVAEGQDLSYRRFQDSTVKNTIKLASAIYSWQFPEGNMWGQLKPISYAQSKDEDVVNWYSECSEVMINHIMNSNFSRKMMTTLHSICGLGTGCISVELKDGRLAFRNHPIAVIYFDEDADGEIRSVSKTLQYTAEQAFQMFGDNAGKSVMKAIEANDINAKFEYIHFVHPRFSYNSKKKDGKNLPYASYYVNVEEQRIVKEDGYYSQVYNIGKYWEFPGEIMGRSPGTESLATSRMFDAASKGAIEAIDKSNNPPLLMEDDSVLGQPSISPNAVITYRSGSEPPKPLSLGADVQGSFQFIDYLKQELGESFFADIWNVFGQHRNMSATEASIRDSERLGQVAPNIKSLERELLDPLFTRCFDLLFADGTVFPPPPQQLLKEDKSGKYYDMHFKIQYTGKLSVATGAIKADQTFMFIDRLAQLAQIQPDIIHSYFNLDETVPELAKSSGVPARYLKPYKQIMEERKAKEQQAMDAQQAQLAQAQAETAKLGAEAIKNMGEASA